MIRICCSKHHQGNKVFGEKEPFENKDETHGYCDECFKLETVEIQIALQKLRDAGWVPYYKECRKA